MGKVAFVEILDRRGNIRERVRIDSFPATIGRGYTNAVIVDDRLVSVEHLRLSLDSEGGMIVEDLNTANGTWLSNLRERIERHIVPAGGEAVIRIGQTVMRLRGDDFAVGPATSSRTLFGPFGRFIENGPIAFGVFAAGFGLNVLAFAQEISKKVIWSDLTGMSLLLLIVFALWTGFWSFLNRLVFHSFRFMTHLAISGIASIAFLTLIVAFEYFEFIFSAATVVRIAQPAGFAVIFSLLLYGHLSVMSELSGRKRMLTSVLISAAILGIAFLINYTREKEFSNELRFSSVMKPLGRKWVRMGASDEFFGDLGKIKAKIDAMAKEGPKDKTVKE
jgi:hypothetical protein